MKLSASLLLGLIAFSAAQEGVFEVGGWAEKEIQEGIVSGVENAGSYIENVVFAAFRQILKVIQSLFGFVKREFETVEQIFQYAVAEVKHLFRSAVRSATAFVNYTNKGIEHLMREGQCLIPAAIGTFPTLMKAGISGVKCFLHSKPFEDLEKISKDIVAIFTDLFSRGTAGNIALAEMGDLWSLAKDAAQLIIDLIFHRKECLAGQLQLVSHQFHSRYDSCAGKAGYYIS